MKKRIVAVMLTAIMAVVPMAAYASETETETETAAAETELKLLMPSGETKVRLQRLRR